MPNFSRSEDTKPKGVTPDRGSGREAPSSTYDSPRTSAKERATSYLDANRKEEEDEMDVTAPIMEKDNPFK